MRTISVLEKFDSVEITNESRITTEELAFCTAQQALYEKVIAQHRNAFAALQTLARGCECNARDPPVSKAMVAALTG